MRREELRLGEHWRKEEKLKRKGKFLEVPLRGRQKARGHSPCEDPDSQKAPKGMSAKKKNPRR